MTTSRSTGNPLFDMWMDNQSRFLQAQSDWFKPAFGQAPAFTNTDFFDTSMKTLQQCEQQYKHWLKVAENWMGTQQPGKSDDASGQTLAHMLNPATFMQSGFEIVDEIFRKLVNGPEFADIGNFEKKLLKTGQEWQAFRDAGHRYQDVIASAWLRAFQHFSDEFMTSLSSGEATPEDTLQRWLKIADEELVDTLRSEEFLEAQKELFARGSDYRLKYKEFVELWCESHTIPTRSEVDDLHKIIYDLRREVRSLKRRLDQVESGAGKKTPAKKAAPRKTAATRKARK